MTEHTTQTPAATVTVPTPPARLFDPNTYHYTFVRATISELRKLTASVGFWITSGIAVLFAIGIGALFSIFSEEFFMTSDRFSPSLITGGWDSYSLFIIPLAVLAVSAEYSHNTMRTTVLSVPSRPIAFASKMTAVLIYCGILSAVIILAETGAVLLFGDFNGFEEHSIRALVMCWIVMTTLALGSAGLAYLLRSTALSIVLIIVVLEFLSMLTLIPNESFQEFCYKYLPQPVGSAAMQSVPDTVSMLMGLPEPLPWGGALALWLGYMAVLIVGGFARFMKSDV